MTIEDSKNNPAAFITVDSLMQKSPTYMEKKLQKINSNEPPLLRAFIKCSTIEEKVFSLDADYCDAVCFRVEDSTIFHHTTFGRKVVNVKNGRRFYRDEKLKVNVYESPFTNIDTDIIPHFNRRIRRILEHPRLPTELAFHEEHGIIDKRLIPSRHVGQSITSAWLNFHSTYSHATRFSSTSFVMSSFMAIGSTSPVSALHASAR